VAFARGYGNAAGYVLIVTDAATTKRIEGSGEPSRSSLSERPVTSVMRTVVIETPGRYAVGTVDGPNPGLGEVVVAVSAATFRVDAGRKGLPEV
jgi:hypothetical protein